MKATDLIELNAPDDKFTKRPNGKRKVKMSFGLWNKLDSRTRKILMRIRRPAWLGTLRHTAPISMSWGKDRGTPVDRYYIEQFLGQHRRDIHGKVLEVGGRVYTDRFGMGVKKSDVLDNNLANIQATIRTDLESTTNLSSDEFDCIVFTQVLQFIYNLKNCVAELHRILRPGGVLLATLPCISRMDPSFGTDKDYWRFTSASSKRLFSEIFGAKQVEVQSYGNVLSSIAFLSGLAYEELTQKELDTRDPLFQLLLSVRAVKSS